MTNNPLPPPAPPPTGPSFFCSSDFLPSSSSSYHIRDSSSVSSLLRPSSVASFSNEATICAVCGDGHAKLHYGVLACYGCKGFFRRTLTGNYQYVCRFGNNCVVDKYQRNSCRCCRFKRCLEVGMDPKAVRPDRDLTGKQRVPRVRKRAMDEELINHMIRLQGDDWSRKIPVESKMLLMQLLGIESKVAKGDCAMDRQLGNIGTVPPAPASSEPTTTMLEGRELKRELSLRELFEQKPSVNSRRTEMCYEPYRMARAEELPKIAHRGAIAAVDWVESLAELIDTTILDTRDKIALVKACYAPLTIFNFSARTAQNTRNPDILCLCSYSFVPRKLPSDFNGSNHLSNNLIDRTLNEMVGPLRKLCLLEEEVVPLKAIICLDPNAKNLSPEAQRGVAELRDRVQDMLFHTVKELHPAHNAASRFGNLLLLLPTITTLSGVMCENMQFCQVFGWTDPLLNELFETDTTPQGDLLTDDGCSLLGSCANLLSFSPPPMLTGGGHSDGEVMCNPADISLYGPAENLSPGFLPNPASSASARASCSSCSCASPSSSPASLSASSSSASSSRSIRTMVQCVPKCEMSTQTDLITDQHHPPISSDHLQICACPSASFSAQSAAPRLSSSSAFLLDNVPHWSSAPDLALDPDQPHASSVSDLLHPHPFSPQFASDGMAFASADPLLFDHCPASSSHIGDGYDPQNDDPDELFGLMQ